MRHLRLLALEVALLSDGVIGFSYLLLLISAAGASKRLPPHEGGTPRTAVAVAVVTAWAETNLLPTTYAIEKSPGFHASDSTMDSQRVTSTAGFRRPCQGFGSPEGPGLHLWAFTTQAGF